jgi:hypothetical protein
MGSMKENAIRDYIASIDFKSEGWGLSEIKENMRRFLGEEPGIDITYKKDVFINEVLGRAEEVKRIEKISIVFTDLDDKFKKIEFLID